MFTANMDRSLHFHYYHPDPVVQKFLESNSACSVDSSKWFKLVTPVDFEALVAALPSSQTLLPRANPEQVKG